MGEEYSELGGQQAVPARMSDAVTRLRETIAGCVDGRLSVVGRNEHLVSIRTQEAMLPPSLAMRLHRD